MLVYNPSMGYFISMARKKKVGSIHYPKKDKKKAYRRIDLKIDGKKHHFYEHKLAWLYVYGALPIDGIEIDHEDGDGTNNKITNLRLLTSSENTHNSSASRGISKKRGVTFDNRGRDKPWVATMMLNGKRKSRYFKTEVEAIKCRNGWEK